MKKLAIVLLCTFLTGSLFAQTDTVRVASDAGSGGNLNTAVSTVISADPTGAKLSNTVFMLEPYGYYILTGAISTPAGSHFHLEAPLPGNTQQTSPPMILWTSSGGVTTTFNFDLFGDATFKNIWILCGNVLGAQVGTSILIEDDSLANLSGKGENLTLENCIIDYQGIGNGGGAVEPACKHFRGKFINTYFRNFADPHYPYYGRPVSWTYQSNTWHSDTIIFENCSMSNFGYAYMQEAPEYADYVSFNHCTFINSIMYTLESSYWWNLSVTNCLFHNAYLLGDQPINDGTNKVPVGGTVNIDSVENLSFSVPFTDSSTAPPALQRHILFLNNSYSHDSWYYDYLANNNYNNTVTQDSQKVHRMPMMSAKTYRFFIDSTGGHKKFPYMWAANLYPLDTMSTTLDRPTSYSATYDPGFLVAPTNIDSLKGFLLGRWYTGANIGWAYNPQDDVTQVWPLGESLRYSNATLKSAGMGNFPLGDIYRWWPEKYASWKAQADAERAQITSWLTNGLVTGVAKTNPGTPATYALSQNYPNPFNPSTEINYSVPQKGFVTLKVYNVLGQEVATLFEGERQAGEYAVNFNASQLTSGVYFYRLQAGNSSITKKMILMK